VVPGGGGGVQRLYTIKVVMYRKMPSKWGAFARLYVPVEHARSAQDVVLKRRISRPPFQGEPTDEVSCRYCMTPIGAHSKLSWGSRAEGNLLSR